MGKKYIGIDIGGTNLKAGLVDEDGRLLATAKAPVHWVSPEDFVKTLAILSKEAALKADVSKEEICAVGMGVPGGVDTKAGKVLYTCNIPLSDLPVAELFRRELDVPVYLENDANCAALGEYYAGAGKGCESLIVITLGTGIGGGIILNGRILHGVNGAAGEVGHMVVEHNGVECPCGRRGCWEQYSSATALGRLTREAMEAHPESALWTQCGGDLEKIGGRSAFEAARLGDAAAQAVCKQYLSYLGQGIVNLINIFQPEMLCIGGGVSNERDEALLFPLREIVERERFGKYCAVKTQVVKAQLGNDAGIIGAALLGVANA